MKFTRKQDELIFDGSGNFILSKNKYVVYFDLYEENKYGMNKKQASVYGLVDYDGKEPKTIIEKFHIYSCEKGFWNRIKTIRYVWKWLKDNS